MASVKATAIAAENYAGSLPVGIDAILSATRARDARGITYLITPAAASPKLSHDGGHVHVVSGVQYLRARTDGGRGNLCSAADTGCAGCYGYGGRAGFDPQVNVARQARVNWLADDPAEYMAALVGECLAIAHAAAGIDGGIAAVRLNGLSDIPWEHRPVGGARCIMDALPAIRWWDYTRVPGRLRAWQDASFPRNYDLTFSVGASNDRIADRALQAGMKIAVVFRKPTTAREWHGMPVIDGDAHDFRFLENGPAVVALKAKGPAMKDKTGWVRETESAGLDLTRVPSFAAR